MHGSFQVLQQFFLIIGSLFASLCFIEMKNEITTIKTIKFLSLKLNDDQFFDE